MPVIDPPYRREPTGYEAVYERRHAQPPKPVATYALLGVMAGMFVLELIAQAVDPDFFAFVFTIADGWWLRPWQLITSTLSHLDLNHLFFNGLFFYFFGPSIESIVGRRRFFLLFFVTGAISGVAQVHLPAILTAMTDYNFGGSDGRALGASGALMGVFGMSLLLMPNSKMVIFPIFVPIPLWLGGLFYIFMDLLGAFNPYDRVGNFAHLAGLVLGLAYGWRVKEALRRRGLKIVTG